MHRHTITLTVSFQPYYSQHFFQNSLELVSKWDEIKPVSTVFDKITHIVYLLPPARHWSYITIMLIKIFLQKMENVWRFLVILYTLSYTSPWYIWYLWKLWHLDFNLQVLQVWAKLRTDLPKGLWDWRVISSVPRCLVKARTAASFETPLLSWLDNLDCNCTLLTNKQL